MAGTLILIVQIYAGIGACVAVAFLTVGIGRVEENARGVFVFRPMLIPGILLIWPLVLRRWWQIETGRTRPRARHRPPRALQAIGAVLLAVLIPVIVLGALTVRQDGPLERKAIMLEAPQ